MKKLKVVQVGIGHDHAIPTFLSMIKLKDLFDVVGVVVCEGEEERWEGGAYKKYPVTRLSLEEALAIEDLDAAIIECDDWNLTRYAYAFAERGVHMHMDKPGGVDQADYEKMLSLVKAKGLVFQTGYMYRYNPVVDGVLRKAKAGEYGEIYAVECHMDCIHIPEKRAWLGKFPGGMMYYLGCHLVDLIVQFCGIPEDIIAFNTPTGFDGVEADDYGFAVLKYKNGVSFAKTCAAEYGGFVRRQLVVCGRNGTVELKPIEKYVGTDGEMVTPAYTRKDATWTKDAEAVITDPFDRYDTMMTHFAEYVNGERENPYTYEYEAQLHKIVLAACGENIDYKSKVVL